MTQPIYTEITASISELKKNPMAAVSAGEGFPIVVLNRNKPAFYCVPADVYEAMLERLDDQELIRLVASRRSERGIPVTLDAL
jgi:antitoxin StbD